MKRDRLFCGFCHSSKESHITGPLLNKDDVVAHSNCLFYSSDIINKNTPDDDDLMGFLPEDVKKEIRRGSKLKCAKCKRSGATVGCEVKRCKRSYHYPCALEANAENIEDVDKGIFKIYCYLHKTKDDRNDSDSSMERKRPRLSNGPAVKRTLVYDSSASDECQNGLDPVLGPLESDLDDSRELGENSPILGETARDVTDEPKPSISGAIQHDEAKKEAKSTAKPQTAEENKTKTPDSQRRTCWVDLTNTQESKDGEADETDIDSDQESESLLVPLKITKVMSIKLDHSRADAHNQQSNLPLPATPSPPEPVPAASASGSKARAQGPSTAAQGPSMAAQFWRKCCEAGCVETIFQPFISAMTAISERIMSEQASEEDFALSFRVLEASGMLQDILVQKDREYEDKLLTLQREIEAVKKSRTTMQSLN
ncbi:uncharacterized protein phf11 isoform X1 [Conger conger]|uniref:uncharacterized protein phf11 isoform X1 n=2 Tax=Conger conger TaxID=82655 RepID=UPI002A598BA8|nr:uncharacterized protein phf11 isoform X1 [Conger conger]